MSPGKWPAWEKVTQLTVWRLNNYYELIFARGVVAFVVFSGAESLVSSNKVSTEPDYL